MPLKLFASFLDNSFQCTKIGDTKSFFNVTCGVPQGSVVGPLLSGSKFMISNKQIII